VIDTGEATFGFWPQQAVRIRDDSDPEEHLISDRLRFLSSSPRPDGRRHRRLRL